MPEATRVPPYLHNNGQKQLKQPPTSIEMDQGGSAAMAVTQYTRQYKLFQQEQGGINNWYLKRNDGTAQQYLGAVVDAQPYNPDFRVAGFSVQDTDTNGVLVQFDLPESRGCVERLVFGLDRPHHITRVYLSGSETTATVINLYG
jgi:hypothetical protein